MTGKPRLFGADYSVYVRIVRLALIEKGVDHELVPVDVFAPEGLPGWYLDLQPFGRIPAFAHGDFRLFETTAITRYVDEAFAGPTLQPKEVKLRARMNQIVAVLDAYAYRTLVWDIYVEAVSKPKRGAAVDEAKVAAALPRAATCLAALTRLKTDGPWLCGEQLTLADLHAAPILAYFVKAPQGLALLEQNPQLMDWWRRVSGRQSFKDTELLS